MFSTILKANPTNSFTQNLQFAEVFFYTLLTIYHLMTSFDAPEEENILKTYWEKEKMLLIIND